jgi:hypothetical protein
VRDLEVVSSLLEYVHFTLLCRSLPPIVTARCASPRTCSYSRHHIYTINGGTIVYIIHSLNRNCLFLLIPIAVQLTVTEIIHLARLPFRVRGPQQRVLRNSDHYKTNLRAAEGLPTLIRLHATVILVIPKPPPRKRQTVHKGMFSNREKGIGEV